MAKIATEYEFILSVRLLRSILSVADKNDQILRFVSTPSEHLLVVDGVLGNGLPWHEVARVEDGIFTKANQQPDEDVAVGGQYL